MNPKIVEAIAGQSPSAHWIASWSNAYSLWDVDGVAYFYTKRNKSAEPYSVKRCGHTLMGFPFKTITKDPTLLDRHRGIIVPLNGPRALEEEPDHA